MPTREDFIGQNNPNVQIYAAENGLIPDYVDEAPMITEADIEGLDNTAFANPYARTYPCHTKVACVQSALWDAATNPGNVLVTNNIKKMAAAHGVADDVEKIYTHFKEAFTKAAAPKPVEEKEASYAIVLADDNGREQGFFETTYPEDIVQSAEEADKQYRAGNIADPYFRKIASRIMGAAAENGVDIKELPQSIRAFGTTRIPDPYAAELTVRDFCKRSNLNPAPYMQELAALQAIMEKSAMMEEAMKAADYVADRMYELNIANGILPRMGDSPYQIIFSGPELSDFNKRAANTVYLMDVPVPAQAIIDMPAETVDQRFAPQAANVIHAAQDRLQKQDDMDKAAAAAEMLSQLSPGAMRQLLWNLSQQS